MGKVTGNVEANNGEAKTKTRSKTVAQMFANSKPWQVFVILAVAGNNLFVAAKKFCEVTITYVPPKNPESGEPGLFTYKVNGNKDNCVVETGLNEISYGTEFCRQTDTAAVSHKGTFIGGDSRGEDSRGAEELVYFDPNGNLQKENKLEETMLELEELEGDPDMTADKFTNIAREKLEAAFGNQKEQKELFTQKLKKRFTSEVSHGDLLGPMGCETYTKYKGPKVNSASGESSLPDDGSVTYDVRIGGR